MNGFAVAFISFLAVGIACRLYELAFKEFPITRALTRPQTVVIVIIQTILLCWGLYVRFA